MENRQIQQENIQVILKTIITNNNSLYNDLKEEFSSLTPKMIKTILLLKLGYAFSEIQIVLDVTNKDITKVYELLISSKFQ
jgi:hypothetical protein